MPDAMINRIGLTCRQTLMQVNNCSAAIFWSAGAGLVLALIMNKGEAK